MANARVRTIRAYSAFVAANFARCSSSSRSTGGHDAAFALNVSALVDSVFQRDIPAVQGSILVIVLFFLVINTLVDIAYVLIDPRIRYT